jgi:hypothetical protein
MENHTQTNPGSGSGTGSILDKVIAANEEQELASFNPVETVAVLFRELGSREQDILRRRFGLHGKGSQTLEQIGKSYEVTRERVRQIENAAIRHIRNLDYFVETVKPVELVVLAALEKHGGIMAEDHLLEYVLQSHQKDSSYCSHLLFLLDKLTANRMLREQRNGFSPSWRVEFADWDKAEQTISELTRILEKGGKPVALDDLLDEFKNTETYKAHQKHYEFEHETPDPIYAHVRASVGVRPNSFEEWGITSWSTVTPKRMGDKIYLIMKKHGKPLHFRDIATHINEAGFDAKKAYPPTVHNELILDDRYVLVGRGIYGLREWGYIPGVVSDVISEILTKADGPLSREDIVEQVLKQRMVKKGTVYLALSNNNRFVKNSDGKYELAQKKTE